MSTVQTEATDLPAVDGAPLPAVRLRAALATMTVLRDRLADPAPDRDLLTRIVETDPSMALHLLAWANAQVAPGEEIDTVAQALEVIDRWTVVALVDKLSVDALEAVPQLWRILARALSCQQLTQDRRGYTVGLLSALGDLYGLPTGALVATAGVSPLVADAVIEHRGRLGAALGALLGYLADDPALIARHGFDAQTVYDAYVQGATTAMTTQALMAERSARAEGVVPATRIAQVPQPRSREPRGDRASAPPAGAMASPAEEQR